MVVGSGCPGVEPGPWRKRGCLAHRGPPWEPGQQKREGVGRNGWMELEPQPLCHPPHLACSFWRRRFRPELGGCSSPVSRPPSGIHQPFPVSSGLWLGAALVPKAPLRDSLGHFHPLSVVSLSAASEGSLTGLPSVSPSNSFWLRILCQGFLISFLF